MAIHTGDSTSSDQMQSSNGASHHVDDDQKHIEDVSNNNQQHQMQTLVNTDHDVVTNEHNDLERATNNTVEQPTLLITTVQRAATARLAPGSSRDLVRPLQRRLTDVGAASAAAAAATAAAAEMTTPSPNASDCDPFSRISLEHLNQLECTSPRGQGNSNNHTRHHLHQHHKYRNHDIVVFSPAEWLTDSSHNAIENNGNGGNSNGGFGNNNTMIPPRSPSIAGSTTSTTAAAANFVDMELLPDVHIIPRLRRATVGDNHSSNPGSPYLLSGSVRTSPIRADDLASFPGRYDDDVDNNNDSTTSRQALLTNPIARRRGKMARSKSFYDQSHPFMTATNINQQRREQKQEESTTDAPFRRYSDSRELDIFRSLDGINIQTSDDDDRVRFMSEYGARRNIVFADPNRPWASANYLRPKSSEFAVGLSATSGEQSSSNAVIEHFPRYGQESLRIPMANIVLPIGRSESVASSNRSSPGPGGDTNGMGDGAGEITSGNGNNNNNYINGNNNNNNGAGNSAQSALSANGSIEYRSPVVQEVIVGSYEQIHMRKFVGSGDDNDDMLDDDLDTQDEDKPSPTERAYLRSIPRHHMGYSSYSSYSIGGGSEALSSNPGNSVVVAGNAAFLNDYDNGPHIPSVGGMFSGSTDKPRSSAPFTLSVPMSRSGTTTETECEQDARYMNRMGISLSSFSVYKQAESSYKVHESLFDDIVEKSSRGSDKGSSLPVPKSSLHHTSSVDSFASSGKLELTSTDTKRSLPVHNEDYIGQVASGNVDQVELIQPVSLATDMGPSVELKVDATGSNMGSVASISSNVATPGLNPSVVGIISDQVSSVGVSVTPPKIATQTDDPVAQFARSSRLSSLTSTTLQLNSKFPAPPSVTDEGDSGVDELNQNVPSSTDIERFLMNSQQLHPKFQAGYTIEKYLGHGATSVVMLGRQKSTNARVAIKFIYKDRIVVTNWVLDRKIGLVPKEVFVLRRMDHPNIIRFFDYFEDADFCYLVMEAYGVSEPSLAEIGLVKSMTNAAPNPTSEVESVTNNSVPVKTSGNEMEGGYEKANVVSDVPTKPMQSFDLYEFLEKYPEVKEPVMREIFRQIAAAVAYIHDNGFVHRDIKDENVLMEVMLEEECNEEDTLHGKSFSVKLGDFGNSSRLPMDRVDYFKDVKGTVQYFAPEMIDSQPHSGLEQDIWSLGVLLYTLAQGQTPFKDVDAIRQGIRRPARFKRSEHLENLIDRMLVVSQEDRISSQEVLTHVWLNG